MTQIRDVLESDSSTRPAQTANSAPADLQQHFFVRRLHLESYLGLCGWERAGTQPITVDVEYALAQANDGGGERSLEPLDITNQLRAFALEGHYDLVEALAEGMAFMLLKDFNISWLLLTVTKRRIFPSTEVGFTIERSSPNC
jgi:dihydroneopterin aldolase